MVYAMELTYDQMVDSMGNAFKAERFSNPETKGDYIDYKGRSVLKGKLWPYDQKMKEIINIVQFHSYWGGDEPHLTSDYPTIEIYLQNKMRLKKIFSHDDVDCSATIEKFMEDNLKFLKDKNINDGSDWGEYKTEKEWKEEEERNKQSNAEGGGSVSVPMDKINVTREDDLLTTWAEISALMKKMGEILQKKLT